MSPRRFRVALCGIVALGFTWRVVYILGWRRRALPIDGDGYFYSEGANLLARGKGFIDPFALAAFRVPAPSATHPPLYELWLAIPSLLGGGHVSQLVHLLWSAVLGTATIALVGVTGREIAGTRVGVIAAAIAAAYPNLWVHDGGLLSETMAIFVATVVILLAYRFARAPSLGRAGGLGAAVGAAALARSELVLAVPLIIVPVVLRAGRVGTTWRASTSRSCCRRSSAARSPRRTATAPTTAPTWGSRASPARATTSAGRAAPTRTSRCATRGSRSR